MTLRGFVEAERDLVIQTSNRGEDLTTVWPFRFGKAAKQLNATIVSDLLVCVDMLLTLGCHRNVPKWIGVILHLKY